MLLSPFTLILLLEYLYGDFNDFTYNIVVSFIVIGVIGIFANSVMNYLDIE